VSDTQWAHNPKVVSSNLTPATNFPEVAVQSYLAEVGLLSRPGTLREARRICFELLSFLRTDSDPRSAALKYLGDCKAQGDHPRTLENRRIRIGAFYKHASWLLNIPKFKYVERNPTAFKSSEISAIIVAAKGRDKVLWKTFWMSGLRLQEMMYLRYSSLTDQGIKIEPWGSFVPKDHDERTVTIPQALLAELRALERVNGSELVFPTHKGSVRKQMLVGFKRCCKRAGLDPDDCWIHKLRATFASTLLRKGLDVRELQKQMGHKSLSSTMRYLCLLDDDDLQKKIESVWE
jgi:integrase